MKNPFLYFQTPPEIIRLAVMMYVRFPLSLRNVEDLLHERGIEVSHEIRKKRMDRMRAFSGWRWPLDEMFVKITAKAITFGEPSTRKARCLRPLSRRRETAPPL